MINQSDRGEEGGAASRADELNLQKNAINWRAELSTTLCLFSS